ncbi:ECF-type sigma factor [Enterovirga rhinocerotis]|nr:ECF-type sigma factor [Enterovirga rhinocerotis]
MADPPPSGRSAGFDALTASLYEQLRRIAHRERGRAGRPETLQTTVLINESYIKLRDAPGFESREHFLGTAATAMRHVLVDAARARLSQKRGSGQRAVQLDESTDAAASDDIDVVRVGEALEDLAKLDPRLARIVECRFFAGYSEEETGRILGISDRTVRRDWVQAKAWLYKELSEA